MSDYPSYWSGKKVVIDAGHGGPDPGAVNKHTGATEKEWALKMAQEVKDNLESHGIKVIMTRDTDRHVSLQERCDIANYHNADLFVSIHMNGAENEEANGFEVYHYAGSTEGKKLAEAIMNSLDQLGWQLYPAYKRRGVKTAEYYVLRNTKMPAVLVEAGFITGNKDAKWITKDNNHTYVALRIAEGILEYLKEKGKEE